MMSFHSFLRGSADPRALESAHVLADGSEPPSSFLKYNVPWANNRHSCSIMITVDRDVVSVLGVAFSSR